MKSNKRLVIAVNTRLLLKGKLEGIGRFAHETLKRMVQAMPEAEFHFFFDRPWHSDFIYGPNVIPHVLYPQARHPFLYLAFFEVAVPYMLKKIQADVYFSPDGYLSLASDVPQVGVMHDIAFMHFPQDIGKIHAWHYHRWFPKFAHKAAQILTVSQYSKQDICRTWEITPDKIGVVYNGCSEIFQPLSEIEKVQVCETYSQGRPYFLYAGAIQPRKNLENLLLAFDAFKTKTGLPHCLVLTGRKAWNFGEVVKTYESMRHKADVIFTGYVTDEVLNQLYNAAQALVYVSRFEGFGLPLLEAMHAETALISSNTSSMPEVAGEAALYVNPESVGEIQAAISRLAEDDALRSALIEKGRKQRKKFSWDQTAQACLEAILRVS